MKLLICLQFHEGDELKAYKLALMIADVESSFRDDVIFRFAPRFDLLINPTIPQLVGRKFKVEIKHTTSRWAGWPGGCNAMALDVLRDASKRTDINGVLMLEPDCLPLRRDWLDQLIESWGAAPLGCLALGAWRDSGSEFGHINGCGIFHPKLYELVHMEHLVGPNSAWDAAIAPYIHQNWKETTLIRNAWNTTTVTEETLYGHWIGERAPVLFHGAKDDSGYEIVKGILKL